MGCGKTTVGRILARQLGWKFIDLDCVISDKEGISIAEIFSRFGEEYFRELESEALERISHESSTVVATGGGLPTRETNWDILNVSYLTVYLKCQFETLYKRIQGDRNRPLTSQYSSKEKLFELYRKRVPYYERARVTIDTDNHSPKDIAEEIAVRADLKRSYQR